MNSQGHLWLSQTSDLCPFILIDVILEAGRNKLKLIRLVSIKISFCLHIIVMFCDTMSHSQKHAPTPSVPAVCQSSTPFVTPKVCSYSALSGG